MPLLQAPAAALRAPEPALARLPTAAELAPPVAGPLPELAGSPAAPRAASPEAESRATRVGPDDQSAAAGPAAAAIGPPLTATAPTTAQGATSAATSGAISAPSAPSASQPARRLDLNLSRSAALQRSGGALALLPAPPPREDKLASEIKKAGKPECSKAYAGLGLLAVVPLALEAVGRDSCKW